MKQMNLQEIQAFSLSILKDIHSFCVENGIHYSLAYGTLIGAVRHKGFIPWDDDIDLIMPRPDYDKFCSLYKSPDYELVSRKEDKGGYMLAFARVLDCKKTMVKTIAPFCFSKEVGIWIDVFPADAVPDDKELFKKQYSESRKVWELSCKARRAACSFSEKKLSAPEALKLLVKKVIYLNGKMACVFAGNVKKRASRLQYGATGHWSQLRCLDDGPRSYHSIDCLSDFVLLPFEDSEFYAMAGYDRYLREVYGDYMQLPPEDQRIPRPGYNTFFFKD